MGDANRHPILLYDGVCGLCNWMVRFVLRHDEEQRFRFAPLQGAFASRVLERHGIRSTELETVLVVLNHATSEEVLLGRSDAVSFVGRELGGVWQMMAWILIRMPRPLRDWGYSGLARSRYRIFGRYEGCPMPTDDMRERFVGGDYATESGDQKSV